MPLVSLLPLNYSHCLRLAFMIHWQNVIIPIDDGFNSKSFFEDGYDLLSFSVTKDDHQ